MSEFLTYKGYVGSVSHCEDGEFYGKIEGIGDLVLYESKDIDGLRTAFEEAVDDYLDDCKSEGCVPDQPLSGRVSARVGPDRHRRAMAYAKRNGVTLSSLIGSALSDYLDREDQAAGA